MLLKVEIEREGGRYLAEVVGVPGALQYGLTMRDAAVAAVELAFRILEEMKNEKAEQG